MDAQVPSCTASVHRHMIAAILLVVVNSLNDLKGHQLQPHPSIWLTLDQTACGGRLVLAGVGRRNVCSPSTLELAPEDGLRKDRVGHRRPLPCCSAQLSIPSARSGVAENRPFSPRGALLPTARRTRLTLGMHAWIPWPSLPTGQITDLCTGSAVRSDSRYFQRPGSLVTSQENMQCHNATVPPTTSHLLRLHA